MFRRVRHWTFIWTTLIQSTLAHRSSLSSVLIVFFHLRLDLPSDSSIQVFRLVLLCFLMSPMRAKRLTNFILKLITQIIFGVEYKVWSSSLFSFLRSPITSSLLGPNILLSTVFSNSFNLCSSPGLRHPHKATGEKDVVLYRILNRIQKINTFISLHIEVFWVVIPCSYVVGYHRFGGPCCLHLQGHYLERPRRPRHEFYLR